jgi:RNA recognition motif. (a.k.a. RRM, RBD, or RNP domain)
LVVVAKLVSCLRECARCRGLEPEVKELDLNELDELINESENAANEVFVGGLPPDATEEIVKEAFARIGTVVSVRLTRRKKSQECKGFGFVRFECSADAERAINEITEARSPEAIHFWSFALCSLGCSTASIDILTFFMLV